MQQNGNRTRLGLRSMRTCKLNELSQGEVGLVDIGGRSACFRLSSENSDALTLVLSNSAHSTRRSDVFSLTLSNIDSRNWPTTLAFNNAEFSPDISSLCQSFDLPERALVPSSDGNFRVAVCANGWSMALLDPATGNLFDHDQSGSSWYFSRWAVTVPSPVTAGRREPIFSVEIA